MLSWSPDGEADDQQDSPFSGATVARSPRSSSVRAAGALDAETSALLRGVLFAAIADGPDDLLVDLRGVWLIDAGAVAVITECHRLAIAAGRALRLAGATDVVRRVLAVSGLSALLIEDGEPADQAVGAAS